MSSSDWILFSGLHLQVLKYLMNVQWKLSHLGDDFILIRNDCCFLFVLVYDLSAGQSTHVGVEFQNGCWKGK